MGSQAHLDKMQLRQNYRNLWHTDLMRTIQQDPPWPDSSLGFGTTVTRVDFDGPCVSYMLRKRALYNDMSRYVCCAGYMPCSGRCGESRCPEFCLATEVFLCFANSVASTRFMLQDEFNIQTTQCDNCIIGFMFCLQQIACIFSIVAMIVGSEEISEASQILSCLSDLVYCSHNTRLKWTSEMVSLVHSPRWQCQLCSKCRASISHTPTVGYPPPAYGGQPAYPPAYGQPNYPPQGAGYPPPAGYPPAGYPPAGYQR
ncbi:UNVERIFIED_CONTAM: hypothetical protein Slati_4323500 [Sesamum latifolium]|uniref:PLAC8 family protein n=1 Tax=Sesamum latifolium TaxID=2727402 RepID=A0AAW2SP86_9LAMI